MFKKIFSLIMIGLFFFQTTVFATTFNDVSSDHWAYSYIIQMSEKGITKGCSTDPPMYCPDQTVTRGQMAAFIIRALQGENFSYSSSPYFSDVPSSNSFFKYIQKMKELNITSGCGGGKFCPDDPVTREQMAKFLVIAKLGDSFSYTQTPYFSDVSPSDFLFKYIQKVKELGITKGCNADGTMFCPGQVVSRAQMAAFLARAFPSAYQTEAEHFNNYASDFTTEMANLWKKNYNLLKIATKDFTINLQDPNAWQQITDEQVKSFNDALIQTLPNAAKVVLLADDMINSAKNISSSTTSSKPFSIFLVQDWEQDKKSRTEIRKPQELFTVGAFLIGMALSGYFGYKGIKNAYNKGVYEPVKNGIETLNDHGVKEVNKILGLPENTSKEDLLHQIDNMPIAKVKNLKEELKDITKDYGDAGNYTVATNKGLTKAAVELGKVAVTQTAGAITTVTGGQGIDKIGTLVTGSEKAGTVIDLAVNAAQKQPLDLLADHLDVQISSKEKSDKTIDKPSKTMTKDEAKQHLQKLSEGKTNEVTISDGFSAGDTIGKSIAEDNADELGTKTNSDGSLTVSTPEKIHIQKIDNPKNNEVYKIYSIISNIANLIFSLPGKFPEIFKNIDLSQKPNIGIEYKDITAVSKEDLTPTPTKLSLTVVVNPNDPAPYQGVNVYAYVSPAVAGVSVSFSIVGTDGYTKSGTYTTNSQGVAGPFYIPGGAPGVADTVTVSIPSQGITKTYHYVF